MWPVTWILVASGLEDLGDPGEIPWDLICAQSIFGLCFNLSLNFGITFTYPLFISIGAALVAPANLMVDIFARDLAFTTLQVVGSVLSVLALLILLLPGTISITVNHSSKSIITVIQSITND